MIDIKILCVQEKPESVNKVSEMVRLGRDEMIFELFFFTLLKIFNGYK